MPETEAQPNFSWFDEAESTAAPEGDTGEALAGDAAETASVAGDSATPETNEQPASEAQATAESDEEEYEQVFEKEDIAELYRRHPELKKLLKDKDMRRRFFMSRQYESLVPIKEAREFYRQHPTPEDRQRLVQEANGFREGYTLLERQPEKFVEMVTNALPQSVEPIMSSLMKVPAVQGVLDGYAKERLETAMHNLVNVFMQDGDEATANALIAKFGLNQPQRREVQRDPLANDPRLRELDQLKANQRTFEEQRYQAFVNDSGATFRSEIENRISATLKKASPSLPEATLARLARQATDRTVYEFNSVSAHRSALQDATNAGLSGRDPSLSDPKAVAKRMADRVDFSLKQHAASELSAWTKERMAESEAKRNATKTVRADVGSGAAGGPPAPKDDIPKNATPRDIIRMALGGSRGA